MTSHDLPVADLVSKHVISVSPTDPLRTVIEHVIEGGVGLVVVLDSGTVAGVISEHDVLRAIHDGAEIDEIWAADIMTIDLVTAEGTESIADIARLMADNRVRHVLVPGDRGGVVSVRDVLEALLPTTTLANGAPRPSEVAAHVAFHLRAAVELGAEGQSTEAASEAALALALFRPGELDRGTTDVDLPLPTRAAPERRAELALRRAALARQLQAHYVSEGQHDLAEVYEAAASEPG